MSNRIPTLRDLVDTYNSLLKLAADHDQQAEDYRHTAQQYEQTIDKMCPTQEESDALGWFRR